MSLGIKFYIHSTFLLLIITVLISCAPSGKEEIYYGKDVSSYVHDLVVTSCGECHSLVVGGKYITRSDTGKEVRLLAGKSKEEWEATILRMKELYDCNIEGDEKVIKEMASYLESVAGPFISSEAEQLSDQDLVEIACGSCHGIVIIDVENPEKIIKRITKSEIGGDIRIPAGKEDWTDTVVRMIEKNGCAIPGGTKGETFKRIVNWLNKYAGPDLGRHLDPAKATGKELTQVYCSSCHGIKIGNVEITKAHWMIELPVNKDLKGWRATVEKMIYKNNCPVPGGTDGEAAEKIIRYLASLDIPEHDLSGYTGRELVNMFCSQCHGLVVGNKRITANPIGVDVVLLDGKVKGQKNDWEFTVARMIEVNGCPVPGGVQDCNVNPRSPFCKIVRFLEMSYGQGCCGSVTDWDPERLTKAVCGSCHGIRGYEKVITVSPGLDMWLFDGKSEDEWRITVSRMINVNGAIIPGGVNGLIFNEIVDWLSQEAGSKCCGYIPISEPELIAQAACGSCHGIVIGSKNNNKRLTRGMSLYLGIAYGWDAMPLGKDEIHWTKTINRMILRRLVTRNSIPDLQQKKAMIEWFVREAGVDVYSDPGTQGVRDPRNLYMTYCHKCHGVRGNGSSLNTLKQWVTNTQVGDPPTIGDVFPNTINLDPGYMSGWWWPPAGNFSIMPYYLWTRYSYGFIDRRVNQTEWSLLRAVIAEFENLNIQQDEIPPEGDSDGDGTIDFPMDVTPPPAPSIISVSKVDNYGVKLLWKGPYVKDLNGYLLFYSDISKCAPDCSSCTEWTPFPVRSGNPDREVKYQMLIFDNEYTLKLNKGTWCIGLAAVDYTCPRPRPLDMKDPLNICNFNMKTVGPVSIP